MITLQLFEITKYLSKTSRDFWNKWHAFACYNLMFIFDDDGFYSIFISHLITLKQLIKFGSCEQSEI